MTVYVCSANDLLRLLLPARRPFVVVVVLSRAAREEQNAAKRMERDAVAARVATGQYISTRWVSFLTEKRTDLT